ncbi:MAG: hypothetical protein WEE89_10580 [Gemmatimonadota bacterium]
MRKGVSFLLLLGLAACDLSSEPETRDDANEFAVRATWNATLAGIGTATVGGATKVTERLGSQLDAEVSLTGGLPTRAYQWRVYRGDCAATAAADLVLFSTIQAYPDLTTDATGTASLTRFLAGALDSTAAYSVRVRLGVSTTNWNGTNPIACGNLQRS